MKTNIEKRKSFTFSCEDYQIVSTIIVNQYGKATLASILKGMKYNTDYFLHLMSAYEKFSHTSSSVHFEYDEKSVICDTLNKAYNSDLYDDDFKAKIKVILEAIFHQNDFTEGE